MKRNLFPFVFMFIIGIAMVGCAEPEGQDENIKATQEILELTLNGPSEELREALGGGVEATNHYDEERFRDFFANENGYSTAMAPFLC